MENNKEKITQEIVQLIEQLQEKSTQLEELGYSVEINCLLDSNYKNWDVNIKVYKPINVVRKFRTSN